MLRCVALRLSSAQQRAQHLKYRDVPLLRDVALLMRLLNDYWYESSILNAVSDRTEGRFFGISLKIKINWKMSKRRDAPIKTRLE